MSKISNRDRILTEGLKVVHERGYVGASVRDIVEAAGVPHGSFTNHFASKEAFGLEVLEIYFAGTRALIAETLRNDAMSPLKGLRAYIDANIKLIAQDGVKNGCLYGNFSAEASGHSELIRKRLVEMLGEVQDAVAYCLKAAVKAGELPKGFKIDETAGFVVASLQGAILLGKATRSIAPVESFKKILFASVLV